MRQAVQQQGCWQHSRSQCYLQPQQGCCDRRHPQQQLPLLPLLLLLTIAAASVLLQETVTQGLCWCVLPPS